MAKVLPGSVYEINLDNGKFAYVCRFNEFKLGLFDIISEKQYDIETVKNKTIIDYKDCLFVDKLNYLKGEPQIKNKWKIIGTIDIENFVFPDVAIYNPNKPELSEKKSEIFRCGNGTKIKVSFAEYKKILESGLTYGTIDNFIMYENYIKRNIDNIEKNKKIIDTSLITTFDY